MFQGWVERWPLQWENDGTFSEVVPDIVDSFGYLSQTILKAPFFLDLLATSPRFLYALNDPAGAGQVIDAAARLSPALVKNSAAGAGSLVLGTSVQATNSTTGVFLGYGGPVATFNNPPTTASYNTTQAATYIDLTTAGVSGPVAGSSGWTRMIAFRASTVPTYSETLWSWGQATYNSAYSGNTALLISGADYTAAGSLILTTGTGTTSGVSLASNVCDGNWHLVFVSMDPTGFQYFGQFDSAQGGLTFTATANVAGVASDTIGVSLFPGNNYAARGLVADVACVAEWPSNIAGSGALTSGTVANLYTSWRSAWSGDTSGQRYSRILTWAGYQGTSAVDTGATTNMGPATDIVPTDAAGGNLVTSGTDALTALNNVVITENGNHYVDANGTLTFKARTARYGTFTPSIVLGENVAAGEIPYEDLAFDNDTTQVANDIQITQFFTSQVFYAEGTTGNPVNPTSQGRFGTRTLQRTVNTNNVQECIDASNYYLYRYGTTDPRVSTLRLHPSALVQHLPNAWPICLSIDIGTRVRVMRRPPGFPPIQWDGFVEKVEWSTDDLPSAFLDLQLSPADKLGFWLMAALHTTLAAQAAAGQNQVTVNPLPDSAVNPFAASVPQGYQFTLDPGTALAETLTVQSVAATIAGYSSCTITFSSNLAYTHAENSVLCELLPSGNSNPAQWGGNSILGTSTILAY